MVSKNRKVCAKTKKNKISQDHFLLARAKQVRKARFLRTLTYVCTLHTNVNCHTHTEYSYLLLLTPTYLLSVLNTP